LAICVSKRRGILEDGYCGEKEERERDWVMGRKIA